MAKIIKKPDTVDELITVSGSRIQYKVPFWTYILAQYTQHADTKSLKTLDTAIEIKKALVKAQAEDLEELTLENAEFDLLEKAVMKGLPEVPSPIAMVIRSYYRAIEPQYVKTADLNKPGADGKIQALKPAESTTPAEK